MTRKIDFSSVDWTAVFYDAAVRTRENYEHRSPGSLHPRMRAILESFQHESGGERSSDDDDDVDDFAGGGDASPPGAEPAEAERARANQEGPGGAHQPEDSGDSSSSTAESPNTESSEIRQQLEELKVAYAQQEERLRFERERHVAEIEALRRELRLDARERELLRREIELLKVELDSPSRTSPVAEASHLRPSRVGAASSASGSTQTPPPSPEVPIDVVVAAISAEATGDEVEWAEDYTEAKGAELAERGDEVKDGEVDLETVTEEPCIALVDSEGVRLATAQGLDEAELELSPGEAGTALVHPEDVELVPAQERDEAEFELSSGEAGTAHVHPEDVELATAQELDEAELELSPGEAGTDHVHPEDVELATAQELDEAELELSPGEAAPAHVHPEDESSSGEAGMALVDPEDVELVTAQEPDDAAPEEVTLVRAAPGSSQALGLAKPSGLHAAVTVLDPTSLISRDPLNEASRALMGHDFAKAIELFDLLKGPAVALGQEGEPTLVTIQRGLAEAYFGAGDIPSALWSSKKARSLASALLARGPNGQTLLDFLKCSRVRATLLVSSGNPGGALSLIGKTFERVTNSRVAMQQEHNTVLSVLVALGEGLHRQGVQPSAKSQAKPPRSRR